MSEEQTSAADAARAPFSPRDYLVHGVYFTAYGLVKYLPSPLGNPLRYWVSRPFVRSMGRVRLYEGVTLWYPYRISLGHRVTLNEWVYISGFGGVEIGDDVSIGHRTTIISSDHVFSDRSRPIRDQGIVGAPVVIESGVFIGCNVTVLRGVRIGEGAVVGAGSVVAGDIPPYAVAAGVPARAVGTRD